MWEKSMKVFAKTIVGLWQERIKIWYDFLHLSVGLVPFFFPVESAYTKGWVAMWKIEVPVASQPVACCYSWRRLRHVSGGGKSRKSCIHPHRIAIRWSSSSPAFPFPSQTFSHASHIYIRLEEAVRRHSHPDHLPESYLREQPEGLTRVSPWQETFKFRYETLWEIQVGWRWRSGS